MKGSVQLVKIYIKDETFETKKCRFIIILSEIRKRGLTTTRNNSVLPNTLKSNNLHMKKKIKERRTQSRIYNEKIQKDKNLG